jgi:hypothetical protein
MPQIAKGGKFIFGWSRVRETGEIVIPGTAFDEYGLKADAGVILISGSRTSGGFAITSRRLLEGSYLGVVMKAKPGPGVFRTLEGKTVEFKGRHYCQARLDGNRFRLSVAALEAFGVAVGDRLLAVRGSGTGLGMIVRGPIIEAARNHPEIEEY